MIATAAAISLFVSACINGTLHGEPKTLCHEFQIRHYSTVETCNRAHNNAVEEWLREMKQVNIPLHLVGSRCGPAEAAGDDL